MTQTERATTSLLRSATPGGFVTNVAEVDATADPEGTVHRTDAEGKLVPSSLRETDIVAVLDKTLRVANGALEIGSNHKIAIGPKLLYVETPGNNSAVAVLWRFDDAGSTRPTFFDLGASEIFSSVMTAGPIPIGDQNVVVNSSVLGTGDFLVNRVAVEPAGAGVLEVRIYKGTDESGDLIEDFKLTSTGITLQFFDLSSPFVLDAGEDFYMEFGGVGVNGATRVANPFLGQTIPSFQLVYHQISTNNFITSLGGEFAALPEKTDLDDDDDFLLESVSEGGDKNKVKLSSVLSRVATLQVPTFTVFQVSLPERVFVASDLTARIVNMTFRISHPSLVKQMRVIGYAGTVPAADDILVASGVPQSVNKLSFDFPSGVSFATAGDLYTIRVELYADGAVVGTDTPVATHDYTIQAVNNTANEVVHMGYVPVGTAASAITFTSDLLTTPDITDRDAFTSPSFTLTESNFIVYFAVPADFQRPVSIEALSANNQGFNTFLDFVLTTRVINSNTFTFYVLPIALGSEVTGWRLRIF